MLLRVNGAERQVDGPLSVAALVSQLGLGGHLAVAVQGEVIARPDWDRTELKEGFEVEIVRPIGGGEDPQVVDAEPDYGPAADLLEIAGRHFRSRLFVGTGKYPDMTSMSHSLAAAGAELVTVAIRYMDLNRPGGGDILESLDLSRYRLLPNTAGAYTVEQAVRMARLAREATGTNWIKLEVIGDQTTLWPDTAGTVEAAKILVKEGFVVLPYTSPDLVTALRLEEAGCATVMPLASLIGSGQGFIDWGSIQRIIERVKVPVVVDAGIGVPSDAAFAMEMGAAAVLVNTAIARAGNPPLMAAAMRAGVLAGRQAYLAGRIPKQAAAAPSSPVAGVPGKVE